MMIKTRYFTLTTNMNAGRILLVVFFFNLPVYFSARNHFVIHFDQLSKSPSCLKNLIQRRCKGPIFVSKSMNIGTLAQHFFLGIYVVLFFYLYRSNVLRIY